MNTIYAFCAQNTATVSCADGAGPAGGLIQGTDGNFYGTTAIGGQSSIGGTVFQLIPSETLPYTLNTLYSFCSQTNCTDGENPQAALLQATDGNFYGTTAEGGTGVILGGTIFKITVGGTPGAPTYALSTIYNFCESDVTCASGEIPYAQMIEGSQGNLYGTAYNGGANTDGTVFSLSVALAPGVSFSPLAINFGPSPLLGSFTDSVTVTNTGSSPLTFGQVTVSGTDAGDFSVLPGGCSGAMLQPAQSCEQSVTFSPRSTDMETATLNFPDNASPSPQPVSLSGSGLVETSGPITPPLPPPPGTTEPGEPGNPPVAAGGAASVPRNGPGRQVQPLHAILTPLAPAATVTTVAPGARFSSSLLTFPTQTVGTSSSNQTITITNSSSGPLVISSIIASDDFSQTNDCGESVAAGGSCSIRVTFMPNAEGARTGTLTIVEGAPGSNQTITLTGNGRLEQP